MKVRAFVLAISIFLILLLQSTVLEYIEVFHVKPNLLIVFVISIALLRGHIEGAVVGFFAGLMQDVASGKVLGFYALLGLYLGLATGLVNKRIYRENFLVVILFTFVSTIVYEFAVYFFNIFLRFRADMLFALGRIILPEAVYNSVASIFVFILVMKLNDSMESTGKALRKY